MFSKRCSKDWWIWGVDGHRLRNKREVLVEFIWIVFCRLLVRIVCTCGLRFNIDVYLLMRLIIKRLLYSHEICVFYAD